MSSHRVRFEYPPSFDRVLSVLSLVLRSTGCVSALAEWWVAWGAYSQVQTGHLNPPN